MNNAVSKSLRWFLPDGLTGRFVFLLTSALFFASLAAFFLLFAESRRFDKEKQDARQIERVLTLVSALESVDRSSWQSMVAEAFDRSIQVSIDRAPSVTAAGGEQRAAKATALLKEALPGRIILSKLDVRQQVRPRPFQRKNIEPLLDNVELMISVELNTSRSKSLWLNSRASGPLRSAGAGLRVLLVSLGLSLIAVLGVGLLFIRQMVGPISDLAKAANLAASGNRSVRVTVNGAREIRQAGTAFNEMQTKIAQFDGERMRTMAAVGHDLRTPITSLRIRAEMIEDPATRDAFVRTLDEMTVMADGLVHFAKSGHENEAKQRLELAPILLRIGNERKIDVVIKQQAKIIAGPVTLTRAIGNLVENALRYAGAARMILDREGGVAKILIEDDGPGISKDKIELMFEPFVRGETSRNTETGGAGLGLSISRAIINSYGGTVRLENIDPHGLRAIVTLPLDL